MADIGDALVDYLTDKYNDDKQRIDEDLAKELDDIPDRLISGFIRM